MRVCECESCGCVVSVGVCIYVCTCVCEWLYCVRIYISVCMYVSVRVYRCGGVCGVCGCMYVSEWVCCG